MKFRYLKFEKCEEGGIHFSRTVTHKMQNDDGIIRPRIGPNSTAARKAAEETAAEAEGKVHCRLCCVLGEGKEGGSEKYDALIADLKEASAAATGRPEAMDDDSGVDG